MVKSEGTSRVGARAGTKNLLRKKCQNATAGVVRRARRASSHYVEGAAVSPNAGSNRFGPTVVPESAYVLANRAGRTLAFIAATEDEARAKAVDSGLVRKPENATLVAINP